MTQPGGAHEHTNPQLLADAPRDLRSLREEVEARIDIDYRAAVRTLATVFGIGPDQQVGGRGHALSAYLYQLGLRTNGNWSQEDGSPEASAALEGRIRGFVVHELREVEAGVVQLVRWQRQDAARLDRAHAEANALPETTTLRDLIAYERHLGGELRAARGELERVVARRRSAGGGRKVGH